MTTHRVLTPPNILSFFLEESDGVASEGYSSAVYSNQVPIPRRPLQELAIDIYGELIHAREASNRAPPSNDKENWPPQPHREPSPVIVFPRGAFILLIMEPDDTNLVDGSTNADSLVADGMIHNRARDLDRPRGRNHNRPRNRTQEHGLERNHDQNRDHAQDHVQGQAHHDAAIDDALDRALDHVLDHAHNRNTEPRLASNDGSTTDAEQSVLTISRAAPGLEHNLDAMNDEEEADDAGPSQENEEADNNNAADPDGALLTDPAELGLKEISNLAKFTVSSHKPGCGVAELRNDDVREFWQSDGPQPHKLTAYFVKRVSIREIRFYVDYNEDESYTPTKIVFKSGTSENNLIEFASMHLDGPVGWQQVPFDNVGGEPDGMTLSSWVLQMQILENHQNGKDTHLRGIKIYAFDGEKSAQNMAAAQDETYDDGAMDMSPQTQHSAHDDDLRSGLDAPQSSLAATRNEMSEAGFTIPDLMREPELR